MIFVEEVIEIVGEDPELDLESRGLKADASRAAEDK